ncbi:MAG: UDP-N-acetylglucosamine--N-acetylmuramyl-(pentapeptide) pyrophosphoryl-undecaprenol N-acetylglucosamine transferase [Verrucomicrobia bacterium]|nr:UDP-N-acetylglucosamine--N-acetylmuramyl-(pentapeptide) pyrophosphoryl-undecaprenol N-acetylglucosamine transferase [Verrucomicrobiota bacterium]MDE3047154.1 UDP-N-acetylglucosamine--N-acetylmuramyl-(pentapeptide) pyrophosphoryl-undecaprenol N-acetylglucosamine transferase [Verrucomicrobiota bacterium]
MRKVLIATGGTGGHLFPAQQLAEQLLDCEVLFAGHKLHSSPFFNRKAPSCEITSASSLRGVWALLKGTWQSLLLLLRFAPDVVVGFGSFHTFPILLAAVLLRKKIVLFEPNCTFGKVNRWFAPFAKKVAFQFPVVHKRAVYVPLLPWKQEKKRASSKDPQRKTILVFGGSQGAAFINQTFCEAAKYLSFPFQVIHLTGKGGQELHYTVPAMIKPFEEDMPSLYARADFAVCRCGAGTSAELIRYNLPAVVIPYPYAHDHQRKNGEFLGQGVRLLHQKDATPERLAQEIEALVAHLPQHRAALNTLVLPNTVPLGAVVRAIGEHT